MVKNEHQLQSMPWEAQHHSQQQLDYYMNLPGSSYTNVNLIINNTNNANRINCNGTSSATMDVKMSSLSTGTSAQTVPSSSSSAPKSRSATSKNSSSSSSHADDFPSSSHPPAQHKEIYPWMSDKKHGSNKSKNSSKNPTGHNTTSTSSSSSSSGKTSVLCRYTGG